MEREREGGNRKIYHQKPIGRGDKKKETNNSIQDCK